MTTTLLADVSILLGTEFELVENTSIEIEDGTIARVGGPSKDGGSAGRRSVLDCRGLLALPGLIDAHTHIGDSIAKDAGVGLPLDSLVHPIHGLKARMLKEAPRERLVEAASRTIGDMQAGGITTLADFREGGIEGVRIARDALRNHRMRAVLLGRPPYHFGGDELGDESRGLPSSAEEEIPSMLELCGGIGLSGANEYTGRAMQQISEIARSTGKMVAIHASESPESKRFSLDHFSTTEVHRLLRYMKPDFMVHLTNSTEEEMMSVVREKISVVCCPRANSVLGIGIPPIVELMEKGVNVALGTDNVMLNSPDMFREMDYTSKSLRALHASPSAIDPKDILRMATVNGAKAMGIGSKAGSIEEGKRADILFLDLGADNLSPSNDVVASIVHRARPDNVKCVMIDGEIVHGFIRGA